MASTQSSSGTVAQVSDQVDASMANAGTVIQGGMNGLVAVRKARLAQQQRQAAAFASEYGPNDPGTVAAQAKVNASRLVVARVSAAQQQTRTPTLSLGANQWALQGNVYDPNAQPIPRLTVFLVDAENAWQRAYGFAYTDSNGYFVLANDPTVAGKTAAPPAPQAAGALYVEIANEKGLPIFLDKTAFQPVLGQATYRKLVLDSQTPIGDPPRPLREVGIPPVA
jgi:hypothetical protein